MADATAGKIPHVLVIMDGVWDTVKRSKTMHFAAAGLDQIWQLISQSSRIKQFQVLSEDVGHRQMADEQLCRPT